MRKLSTPLLAVAAVLLVAPIVFAQATGCSIQPAFSSSLVGTGGGFANASLLFDTTNDTATLSSSTLGLNDITGISLFQGTPGTADAQLIRTFTGDGNAFTNGRFNGSVTLDPAVMNQIMANPQNYFFVITTAGAPEGAVFGPLTNTSTRFFSGSLSGTNIIGGAGALGANGTLVFSLTPDFGGQTSTLNFDLLSTGLNDSQINSLQLMFPGAAPMVIASGSPLDNGRLTGSVQIPSSVAQQLICNPNAFSVMITSPHFSNGAIAGNLSTDTNELFIPVAGSARGANNTNWKTDLTLLNNTLSGNGNTDVLVQFFPAGGSNGTFAQGASTTSIAAHGLSTLRDLSSSLFNNQFPGIGALRIITSGNVFANARIFNDQSANGLGTFGEVVPGMTRSQALSSGTLAGVMTNSSAGATGSANAHTNIGFFNPSDNFVTVALELRDANGDATGSRQLTLAPWQQMQLPLAGSIGVFNSISTDVAPSSVVFLSSSPIFAYASIVDNVSGDSAYLTPMP